MVFFPVWGRLSGIGRIGPAAVAVAPAAFSVTTLRDSLQGRGGAKTSQRPLIQGGQ